VTKRAVSFGISYFGVRDPRHARRDLDEIAEAGFAAVTHTFSEHDLRYHAGDVARLVEESRARGLEVALDPWGVGGLFGGEAYSELALTDLSCRQIDAGGNSVPACCPNAGPTRALLRRWASAAAQLRPDFLFWDEPHFYLGALRDPPALPCCRCAACRAAWGERGGTGPLPPEGDPRLAEFRARSLRSLLEEAIREAGEPPRHCLCLLPRGEFRSAATDEWDEFSRVAGVSRLATDPYWMERDVDPAEYVRAHAAPLRELCDETGRQMEIWIQAIRIPAGREESVTRACRAALETGAERISFWSFRGTERMSSLACGDPDAAWEAMTEAVRAHAG
jgi:hypothetical protein